MKRSATIFLLSAAVLLAEGCTTVSKMGGGAAPVSTPAAAVPAAATGETKTITGTVVNMHLVKGWGFSNWDVAVSIQTADGTSEFFAADKGVVVTPDGQQTPIKKINYKVIKNKQVEIKYFTITNAKGGLEKYENGKPGIVTMRILN